VSIIVGNDTKLVVSGLTGREGSFHGLRNRDYGTDLVAGVNPKKGGEEGGFGHSAAPVEVTGQV
jgi:succinyl-CoA synthetase alpha subunit